MRLKKGQIEIQRIPIESCHLYGLQSPKVLAHRCGWDLGKLEALAVDGGYKVYPHPETGRIIQQPGEALQSFHRDLHRYLARVEVPAYLHSAVKRRSYLTNAQAHLGSEKLAKIDVAKFYRSISRYRVRMFFINELKCAADVAGLVARLICYNDYLATGSSVSPILSYFVNSKMFARINGLAERNDLVLTCYVDDISLSGTNVSAAVLHEVRMTINREGYRAHKDSLALCGEDRIVTGVKVGASDTSLPSKRWKKIRDHIKKVESLTDRELKNKEYPKLISRLYEAAQVESGCRQLAEKHHAEWKRFKAAAL